MRTGEDTTSPFDPPFDGGLLQVMPWPVFGKKTDRDLTAVYEYLRAIPSRPLADTACVKACGELRYLRAWGRKISD